MVKQVIIKKLIWAQQWHSEIFLFYSVVAPPLIRHFKFPRNTKMLVETKLTQKWKDVPRHSIKLQPCNIVTMLALHCQNVARTSIYNIATTLFVGKTFVSNELKPLIKPILWCCGNVLTTSLRFLSSFFQ